VDYKTTAWFICISTSEGDKNTNLFYIMGLCLSPSDHELQVKARGVPVLPSKQVEQLILKAREKRYNKIKFFFNLKEGWLLRRVVRAHYTVLIEPERCALCGGNVKGALRPLTNTKCSVCCVPLCRFPRDGETGLSCFDEWHEKDVLERRIYWSQPTLSKIEETGDTLNGPPLTRH